MSRNRPRPGRTPPSTIYTKKGRSHSATRASLAGPRRAQSGIAPAAAMAMAATAMNETPAVATSR